MKPKVKDEKWVSVPFSRKDYRVIAVDAAKCGVPICRYVSQLAVEARAKRK